MKKCINLIYLVLISSSLNAMISEAPNVTKWQEICKNPEEKQQLITVYKDFCQKRIKNNIAWTAGSLAPFIFKSVRQNGARCGLIGLFALRQTYFLLRNTCRNQLASQEDLSYLNHDVLEQLGNPDVNASKFNVVSYDYGNYVVKTIFGYRPHIVQYKSNLLVDEVGGIEMALSGNYKDFHPYYYYTSFFEDIRDEFRLQSFAMKKKVELRIKEINVFDNKRD